MINIWKELRLEIIRGNNNKKTPKKNQMEILVMEKI